MMTFEEFLYDFYKITIGLMQQDYDITSLKIDIPKNQRNNQHQKFKVRWN